MMEKVLAREDKRDKRGSRAMRFSEENAFAQTLQLVGIFGALLLRLAILLLL
jgi:hypothetical protein